MAVSSDNDADDVLAKTRAWIDKVNRGGLFSLSDDSFRFFVCVEKEVKRLLPTFMVKSNTDSHAFKEDNVKRIMHSDDVDIAVTVYRSRE